MFALLAMQRARVLDVRTLAAKDRKPDEPPGAQLLVAATLSSEMLAMFDGFLPGVLYRKAGTGEQGKLEGMEGAELTSIGDHVKRMPWQYEQTGCTVEIDRGLGGKRNIALSDCRVHRVSFAPQQGGSVKVQWTVDAPAQSDDVRGKLTGLKATDIEMTLAPPEVGGSAQQEIGETKPLSGEIAWPFPGKKAAANNGSGEAPPQKVVTETVKPQTAKQIAAQETKVKRAQLAALRKAAPKPPTKRATVRGAGA